jgi:hypothetical protein
MRARVTAGLPAVLAAFLVVPLLAGCGGDEFEGYCGAVKDHQAELTDITSTGEPDAQLKALAIYRELRDEAPDDVRDEWQQVVVSLEGLQDALDDAGVDPATYDPKKPPEGVTQEQQDAIAAAATEVGSRATQQALAGVDQQARDVCHTPLTL